MSRYTYVISTDGNDYPMRHTTIRHSLVDDPVAFKKTKHILRAAEFVRDRVLRCYVTFVWICGRDNIADLFTKCVELAVFRHLLKLACNLLALQ